jgi:hypothetical protein
MCQAPCCQVSEHWSFGSTCADSWLQLNRKDLDRGTHIHCFVMERAYSAKETASPRYSCEDCRSHYLLDVVPCSQEVRELKVDRIQ